MLADHLKKILKDKALVPRTNAGSMILKEKRVMKVEVTGMPLGVTAIDIEKIGSFSGLNDGEWKQRCDYLLVYEVEGQNIAIFVELKKTLNQDNKKAMEQLRRSPPILKYLHSVYRIHYGIESEKPVMTTRYFLIGEKINQRLDKQPVPLGRPLPSVDHKNITVNKFVGPRIRFDLLRSE